MSYILRIKYGHWTLNGKRYHELNQSEKNILNEYFRYKNSEHENEFENGSLLNVMESTRIEFINNWNKKFTE